jgi:hypothetical protein
MTIEEIHKLVGSVRYPEWSIEVYGNREFGYLQVTFRARDTDTGDWKTQRGRKWQLSQHMTRSEVIQTAFKAILTAVEHEARESFTYKGVAVFGPHLDVDALVEIHSRHDVREPIQTTI